MTDKTKAEVALTADTDPILTDEEFADLDTDGDGVVHLMESELIAGALSKDADEPQQRQNIVIHKMEVEMNSDGVAPIDPTPPDPEAPIDSRKGDEPGPRPTLHSKRR